MSRSTALAVFRVFLLIGLTVYIIVIQGLTLLLRLPFARQLQVHWHRWCCRAIGMQLIVSGVPLVSGPALFVSNHVSYIDIAALGSVVDASFISRADVRAWPVFGFLATLQRTMFIERKPRYARQQMRELSDRLATGDRLILFPEGMSSDGNAILPFKSSLFAAAEIEVNGKPVQIQPISLAYTRIDGIPLGRLSRPIYAWYGDMEFAPHFWHMLGFGRFRVEFTLHDPVTLDQFASRKELSQYCERVVTVGFSHALSGRTKHKLETAPAVGAPSTA